MRRVGYFVMYIWASISDMRNRTIPNRTPVLLVGFMAYLAWPQMKPAELLMNALWSELFVIGVLDYSRYSYKIYSHMSSGEEILN